MSKKRASDVRLSKALNQFTADEKECHETMAVMCRTAGWELLGVNNEEGIVFKVALDQNRYFIAQLQQTEDRKIVSKHSPAIRFANQKDIEPASALIPASQVLMQDLNISSSQESFSEV